MTRVLLVEEFKTTGGEEEVVYNLFEGLSKISGFEVYVAAPESAAYFKKHALPRDRHLALPMSSKIDVASINRLRDFVRDMGIDVVHSHGDRAGLIARVACFGLPVKSVWTMHAYSGDNKITQGAMKRRLKLFVQSALNRFLTDRVVCVSKNLEKTIAPNMPAGSTVVIYNGVDLSRFRSARKDRSNRETLRILFAGRLSEQKGLPYLLGGAEMAAARGIRFQLNIAGEGPLLPYVKSYISDHGLSERCNLLGFRSDIDSLLESSDLLLLPSLFEGFPIIILESLASGTPVIASAVNGVPEIVVDRQNGLLIEPGSSQAVAEAIGYAAGHPSWLRSASDAALASSGSFSVETMVEKHARLYLEISCDEKVRRC